MRLSPLSALRIVNPTAWELQIRQAIAGRTYREAGPILGIHWRTLQRWAHDLGIVRPKRFKTPRYGVQENREIHALHAVRPLTLPTLASMIEARTAERIEALRGLTYAERRKIVDEWTTEDRAAVPLPPEEQVDGEKIQRVSG